MADRPGDEPREIAHNLRAEAELWTRARLPRALRPLQPRIRLLNLASRLDSYADSIDETIAVLSDPDAMAAIEDDWRGS